MASSLSGAAALAALVLIPVATILAFDNPPEPKDGEHAPAGDQAKEAAELPCGVVALYLCTRLAGRDTTAEQVRSGLGPPHPQGHSFDELVTGAARLGLPLRAYHGSRPEDVPPGPLILYFRRDGHGHFAAARRVGHTGTLVQVFDHAWPEVVDLRELAGTSIWTGLFLAPTPARWPRVLGGATVVAAGLVLLTRRRRRPVSVMYPN
jgi:hypothetical protein